MGGGTYYYSDEKTMRRWRRPIEGAVLSDDT
jgi:hypothetical protein